MAKGNEIQVMSNSISQIAGGTEIRGEVICQGDLRIDGSVVGNVSVQGKLVIGEKGRVDGEVACRNCDVSGYLKGKLAVQELLALKSSSQLYGEISTKKLSIEPGSIFTGTCTMGQDTHSEAGTPRRANVVNEPQPVA